jgi:hypothetical protein
VRYNLHSRLPDYNLDPPDEWIDYEELAMHEQPQEAMEQDQAEQGVAQEYDDFMLREILRLLYRNESLGPSAFKYLCGALKIDIRDVT